MWLSGLSAGLWTKGQPVQFPVRAHAWVAGQVPSRGQARGNHTWMFLSLSFSLPSPVQKINKIFQKQEKKKNFMTSNHNPHNCTGLLHADVIGDWSVVPGTKKSLLQFLFGQPGLRSRVQFPRQCTRCHTKGSATDTLARRTYVLTYINTLRPIRKLLLCLMLGNHILLLKYFLSGNCQHINPKWKKRSHVLQIQTCLSLHNDTHTTADRIKV